jgi:hypothetical protein
VTRARPPAGPVRSDTTPKPRAGVRRLVRLAREDDVRFRSLVRRVSREVEGTLAPGVVANRGARGTGPSILAPWRPARRRWEGLVRDAVSVGGVAIATDVADCYASIGPSAVGRALERAGAGGAHVDELVRWLRALEPLGVEGLPVGPEPSAILANAVLSVGDRALEAAGVRWFRWVDDWVLVAADRSAAERALDALASALRPEGLRLHGDKTRRWDEARAALADRAPRIGSALGQARDVAEEPPAPMP